MESTLRRPTIQALKVQLEVTRLQCESFAKDLDAVAMLPEQKLELLDHLNQATKASHAAQLMLALLERQRRERRTDAGF
jgi:hypothetical protein